MLIRGHLLAFLAGVAAVASSCAKPDGAAEFKRAQEKFRALDHVTMEWTTRTALGVFTESAEMDCGLGYYHYRYIKDLSAKGIADDTTQSQGRPKAHQEEERLFAGGKSYTRFSGSWEDPRSDNSMAWSTTYNDYDPQKECTAMRNGTDSVFLPFKRILAKNQIEYVDTRTEGDARCHAYRVVFPDVVYTDTMKTTDLGGGNSISERQTATRDVGATVCLAVSDGLPRQVVKDDMTVSFSYRTIIPLPAPEIQRP